MFYDSAAVLEHFAMATSTPALLPLPTSSSSGHHHHSSVAPVPTVYPQPSYEWEVRGNVGDRTLWVVFVGMLVSSLVFAVMAYRQPASKRLFHVITLFVTTFATLSYYAMAVGQGVSLKAEHKTISHQHGIPDTHVIVSREVYWARYVDWSVTTPLLLLDLAFLAGMNGSDIIVTIVFDIIMILTGLFAGLSEKREVAWAWYAMACLAFLVVIYQLAINGRAVVKTKDSKTATFFASIAGFTLILWLAYPIIWGIADGSRMIGVDAEIVAYAVLDLAAKPVFGLWLLFTHDSGSTSSVTLNNWWAHGIGGEGNIRIGDDEEGA